MEESARLNEEFIVEYTYNSNAIEGNTLTLRETDLVLRGLTIDQKPLKDHMEAVGHKEAFDFVSELVENWDLNVWRRKMNVSLFSNQYLVRKMCADDAAEIYALCYKNSLYYQHCPPFVSEQSIMNDMNALPPNKEMCDKYYLGFYDGEKLIAVMDFIMAYPDELTAFIGFFMTDVSIQNTGTGSRIIDDLCTYLARIGIANVRLGWVKGNPQAEHFWHKNGFKETGITYDTENYTVIVAQRGL